MTKLTLGTLPGALFGTGGCVEWQRLLGAGDEGRDVSTWVECHLLASTTLQSKAVFQDLVVTSNFCTTPG
jgi:hypothetical protein